MPWARAALKHASAVWISMQSLRTPQLASPLLSTSIGGRGGEGGGGGGEGGGGGGAEGDGGDGGGGGGDGGCGGGCGRLLGTNGK